jgi:hypothetical protein
MAPTHQVLDEAELLVLYEQTAARLHRYVARRAAQDVVSEAFLVLLRQRAGQPFDADSGTAPIRYMAKRHIAHSRPPTRVFRSTHGP